MGRTREGPLCAVLVLTQMLRRGAWLLRVRAYGVLSSLVVPASLLAAFRPLISPSDSHLPYSPSVPAALQSRASSPKHPLLPQEPIPQVSYHPIPKFLLPWGCFTRGKLPGSAAELRGAPGLGSGAQMMAWGCDLAPRPPAGVPGCTPALSPGRLAPGWSLLPASAPASLFPITPPSRAALGVRQQPAGRDTVCIPWEMLGPRPQFGGGELEGVEISKPVQGCDGCSGWQGETSPPVPRALGGPCCCHIAHCWKGPACPHAPGIPGARGWSTKSCGRAAPPAHGCLKVDAR